MTDKTESLSYDFGAGPVPAHRPINPDGKDWVFGKAKVCGDAEVCGNAEIGSGIVSRE